MPDQPITPPVEPTPTKAAKELPDVTVLVCTYNRYEMLIDTLIKFAENVDYPPDKLHYLICDDDSPGDYRKKLIKDKRLSSFDLKVVSTDANSGWGANVNNGLAAVPTEYTVFLEDDYQATAAISLNAIIALMEVQQNIGMVRLRGIAGTKILALLNEADISPYLPDWRDGQGVPGKLAYWQLSSGSETPYVYSNGPHVKHTRFHEFYGNYPTDKLLGATEESYAHSVKDAMAARWQEGAPAIAILPADVIMWFDHVGESYQLGEHDKTHD